MKTANVTSGRCQGRQRAISLELRRHLASWRYVSRATTISHRLGFDETAPGVDGGTALHAACWVGNVRMVERLLERGRVEVDGRDPTHLSTPLGWAAFGSVHRRAPGADYVAVVNRLVAAGANIGAPGNRENKSLLAMAEGNRTVQEALRRHGARHS